MGRGKFWLQIAGRPGGRNPPPRPEAGLTLTHYLPQCNPSPITPPTRPSSHPPGREFRRHRWAFGTPPTVSGFLPGPGDLLHHAHTGAELHFEPGSVRAMCFGWAVVGGGSSGCSPPALAGVAPRVARAPRTWAGVGRPR